jgi:hypothetical protein
MSGGKRKKPGGRKASPKPAPASLRLYWTLAIWPLAIAGLLYYQSRKLDAERRAELEREVQQIEERYENDLAELELQVDLLEKQLQFKTAHPAPESRNGQ